MHAVTEAAQIDATLDVDRALVRLYAYAARARFEQYRDTCVEHGAKWDPKAKAAAVPIPSTAALLASLHAAGFSLSIDARLRAAIDVHAQDAAKDAVAGAEHLAWIDAQTVDRGLALHRFQRVGVDWLVNRERALLGDDMGLGKSVQAACALPKNAAAVIVCPASLKLNWAREVATWRPDLEPIVRGGEAGFFWPRAGQVVIVNFDILPQTAEEEAAERRAALIAYFRPLARDIMRAAGRDSDAIEAALKDDVAVLVLASKHGLHPPRSLVTVEEPIPAVGTVVIADEAHYVKNRHATRTKRFRELVKNARDQRGRCWLLTGTPLINRPRELWDVLDVAGLADEAFGTFKTFKQLVWSSGAKLNDRGAKLSTKIGDRLRTVMLRRMKTEVLKDLPPKSRVTRVVDVTDAEALAACESALEVMRERGLTLEKVMAMVEGSAKVAPEFEWLQLARHALALAKIHEAVEFVEAFEDAEEPVVVMTNFRGVIEALTKREGWAAIHGEVPIVERQRVVDEFQAGRLRGVACSIRAAGIGLTLTHACHMVFVDLDWTPAGNAQAEDRICRMGQGRPVTIHRLLANHALDRMFLKILDAKMALFEATVDAASVGESFRAAAPQIAQLAAASAVAAIPDAPKPPPRVSSVPSVAPVQPRDMRDDLGRLVRIRGAARGARNARERWAADGIVTLHRLDLDRARRANGAGFSQTDTTIGNSYAEQWLARGVWTDKQWAFAVTLAMRYRRQIGEPPG